MKAEAILRGGNAATLSALCAEPAFQLIRERANQPVYTPETLTLDELINERGREFAWEGWRRTDWFVGISSLKVAGHLRKP